MSFYYGRLPLVKISAKLSHMWEQRTQNTLKMSHFLMAADLPRNHFNIYNLGTKMLYITAYLYENFNLA